MSLAPPDGLRLVWIDLEMTGLNAATDHVLEIAAVVTGADLEPLGEIERVIRQPDDVLERMSGRVKKIHTDNGLLAAVTSSTTTRAEAERAVLELVSRHCPPGEGILCGSSVYHDWRFLVRHMPRLEQHLHFRQIDIGTVSVLVSAWYPQIEFPRAATDHRALADVRASLEELRYYCKHAFQVDLSKLARPRPRGLASSD
jgi:oligoribonuclease